jgi:hypothetical protein
MITRSEASVLVAFYHESHGTINSFELLCSSSNIFDNIPLKDLKNFTIQVFITIDHLQTYVSIKDLPDIQDYVDLDIVLPPGKHTVRMLHYAVDNYIYKQNFKNDTVAHIKEDLRDCFMEDANCTVCQKTSPEEYYFSTMYGLDKPVCSNCVENSEGETADNEKKDATYVEEEEEESSDEDDDEPTPQYIVDFVNKCVRTKRGRAFRSSEVARAFKDWFLEYNTSYSSKIVPKINEVFEYLNTKFETSQQGGVWFNVELIVEDDDDEKDKDYEPSEEEESSEEESEDDESESEEDSEEDSEEESEPDGVEGEDPLEDGVEGEDPLEDGGEGEDPPCQCIECVRYVDGWNGGWSAAMKHIGSIIQEDGFVQDPTRCTECESFFSYLMDCSGTCGGKMKYCSYKCQKKHWNDIHKHQCNKL